LEAPEDEDSGAGIFEYCFVICRNKKKILLAGVVGLIIGFLIGIPMKSVYRAATTLEVLAMNQDFMNMKGTNPVNTSVDSDVSEEQTQASLLSSVIMKKRVSARLDPNSALHRVTSAPPAWRTLLHLGPPATGSARSILISKAAATLKVKATAHTRILEATVDSSDPDLAADYLNALAQEFIQQNQESRLSAILHTGDWLSHELGDTRDKLRKSEDALQEYARNSGIILTNETTNVATEKLQQYQLSLTAASADRIAKQSRLELAQSSPPESLADVLNDGSLRDTQSKINDVERQIADLSTIYSPEYSKLRRLQAELQSLQTAFGNQRTDILSRIRTDYQEASRKERLLTAAYDNQTREVTGQGEKSIQYNILKREVDSNRQLYDAMLQQMKQASIATAMRASSIRIVDAADVPMLPRFPNFRINSAVGLLAGLLSSTIVVLVRDQLDRTLQLPGDIKQWAELPELGTIPNAYIAASKSYYLYYNSLKTVSAGKHQHRSIASVGLPDGSPGNGIELATWQKSSSLLAESFRSALTSILCTGENGSRPCVLVFTSANPAEGKTTVVSNLAIAASEIRLKVLIIDADLRRSRMHQLFNLPNERGLTDFLQEEMTQRTLAGPVQKSAVPNLHILTAGPETRAAAHLLYSPNFTALIKRFRDEYDMILIDTPPMLQMTDARIISRQADAVVLVARAGATTRDSLLAAKERFDEDRTRIIGSILNDWDPKRPSAAYYDNPAKSYRA
jgi:capsular exopolysaccharide synthesis family protein